jgi:CarD family transcriptional regulator
MSVKKTAFAVGQKVVYPSQGVGIIREILKKKFKDAELLFYEI